MHASAIVPLKKLKRRRSESSVTDTTPLLHENGSVDGYLRDGPRGILVPDRRSGSRSIGAATPGSINQFSTPVQSDAESDVFGTPKSAGSEVGTPMMQRARSVSRGAVANTGSRVVLSPEGLAKLDERLITLNRRGEEAVQDVWDMATSDRFPWHVELEKAGVTVSSCTVGTRNVLKAEGLVRVSPSVLFHILYTKDKTRTSWNPIIER